MRLAATLRVTLAVGTLAVGWPAGAAARPSPAQQDHAAHQEHEAQEAVEPAREHATPQDARSLAEEAGLPAITDADRAAAFPDVGSHAVHDSAVHSFVLLDQLEWRGGEDGGANWDNRGWIGYDRDRFWFRTEGETAGGRLEDAEAHVLYGRAFARWWDVVAGVREDVRPGPSRTWAAIGIQGLAPYWFELEATAYVGASGRTQVRIEGEYELLLTNRVILQPRVEMDLSGKADPERALGSGLNRIEVGLRLRYEIRRELAPYLGLIWTRTSGGTADFARAAGREVGETRLAGGLRFWF